MKKLNIKKTLIIMVFMLLTLSACATVEELPELSLDLVDVKIVSEPQRILPGEPVTLKATVTLHGELVDADKMIFELWEDGHQADSENIEGTHAGTGTYTLTRTFDKETVYYAVSHVDYGVMHIMPKLKLVVGDVPGEDPIQEQVEQDNDMGSM